MERIKDHLLLEEEFVQNQERLKPQEDKDAEERTKVDDLRGTPMTVGTLEEIIDDEHAIVSSSTGPEHYVPIMSFVDKDMLEPGCQVLLHNNSNAVVGVLADDADPMVSVMKVDKAPTESYADVGGLDQQIQEIKVSAPGADDDEGVALTLPPLLFAPARNPSNSPSPTPSSTKRWAFAHQRALSSTVPPAQARPSSRKPSPTKPPPPSSAW